MQIFCILLTTVLKTLKYICTVLKSHRISYKNNKNIIYVYEEENRLDGLMDGGLYASKAKLFIIPAYSRIRFDLVLWSAWGIRFFVSHLRPVPAVN